MRVKCKWENQSLCLRSNAICKTINRIPGLIQKSRQSHICQPFCAQTRWYLCPAVTAQGLCWQRQAVYFPGLLSSAALRAGNSVCNSFLQLPWAISDWHNLSLQNCFLQRLSSEGPLLTKLYNVPWRSTDSDFLGMEMRKGFQDGPSVRRWSLQHPGILIAAWVVQADQIAHNR